MTRRVQVAATAISIFSLLIILAFPLSAEAGRPSRPRFLQRVAQKLNKALRPNRVRSKHRVRANAIRSGISMHKMLKQTKTAVDLAQSNILSNDVAKGKKYSDSWTCRSSSRLLIQNLSRQRVNLKLDSAGQNTFKWGKEGWVSYHYYAVDNPKRPTVLLDPTAFSNFGRDAQPGGMLHQLLGEAGRSLGQPKAAERVAQRIARPGFEGLLVLANQPEIAVYKDALERAARTRAQVTRNAERH